MISEAARMKKMLTEQLEFICPGARLGWGKRMGEFYVSVPSGARVPLLSPTVFLESISNSAPVVGERALFHVIEQVNAVVRIRAALGMM